jgi:hypothetical protein
MVRFCPATVRGVPQFDSCFIWAPDEDIKGAPITITVGRVTIFNYIYYPLDVLYYAIVPAPTSRDSGRERVH